MYYSGILILLTWVAATPFLIKRTYKQVVFYHEIGNINLRQNFEGEFRAKINLKRGKIRLVHLNRNRNHVNSMIDKLREYQLETKNHSIAS